MDKNNTQKKTLKDILKGQDKTRLFNALAYVVIMLLSVFVSAFAVDFDVTKILSWTFIGNLAFNYAVAIMALFIAILDGENYFENRLKGMYFDTKAKFNEVKTLFVSKNVNAIFPEYIDYRYKKEQRNEITNLLLNNDIDISYYDIDRELLNKTLNEPIFIRLDLFKEISKEEYFDYKLKGAKVQALPMLTQEQYLNVVHLHERGVNLPRLQYSTFLSLKGSISWRKVALDEQRKKTIKRWSIFYRALFLFLFSAIIAITAVSLGDAPTGKVLTDTMSRLFNLISSIIFGYSIAHDEDTLNIEILDYKTSVIQDSITEYETGKFKPEDIEDKVLKQMDTIAKAKEEEERKKQEAIKNVIDPDKVQDNKYIEIEMTDEQLNNFLKK